MLLCFPRILLRLTKSVHNTQISSYTFSSLHFPSSALISLNSLIQKSSPETLSSSNSLAPVFSSFWKPRAIETRHLNSQNYNSKSLNRCRLVCSTKLGAWIIFLVIGVIRVVVHLVATLADLLTLAQVVHVGQPLARLAWRIDRKEVNTCLSIKNLSRCWGGVFIILEIRSPPTSSLLSSIK